MVTGLILLLRLGKNLNILSIIEKKVMYKINPGTYLQSLWFGEDSKHWFLETSREGRSVSQMMRMAINESTEDAFGTSLDHFRWCLALWVRRLVPGPLLTAVVWHQSTSSARDC